MNLSPQLTGNAGLYYCCYRLSLLGWNVMPTARNARGVDIIAYNADASKMISIQVKSLSKRAAVPLGLSLDGVIGDYWIIVNKVAVEPSAFIMLPSEVKKLSTHNVNEGRVSHWLEPAEYDNLNFRERWERIGVAMS